MKFSFSKYLFLGLVVSIFLYSCSGSAKYYKAGEKLEKKGLVNEAAEFYLESLKRNNTNTKARIKLKEVGQKYLDFLSSKFFREYNVGENESAISTFEKLKDFYERASILGVELSYPSAYKEDYQVAVNNYVEDNYNKGVSIYKQKRYKEAIPYFEKVKKFNKDSIEKLRKLKVRSNKTFAVMFKDIEKVKKYYPEYKKVQKYYTIATCEPLYQSVLTDVQNKNYKKALQNIEQIHRISTNYKSSKEIESACLAAISKDILVFRPKLSNPYIRVNLDKELTDLVLNNIVSQTKINYVEIKEDNTFGIFYYDAVENNKELLSAIAKAANADYFFVVYINNRQVNSPSPQSKQLTAYQQFVTKVGENYITNYKPVQYNNVKVQKSYGFNLNYKLIQTSNLQVVLNQLFPIVASEKKEYNEFLYKPTANIKDFFPYNPAATPPFNQYNPKQWRELFFVNKQMKTDEELKQEAIQKAVHQIQKSLSTGIK